MSQNTDVCFVVVGQDVLSRHGWNDAIELVCQTTRTGPLRVWIADDAASVRVFDGPARSRDRRQIATIYLSEAQFQAAKSRGDIP